MKSSLAAKSCAPCRGGVLPLNGEELKNLTSQLPAGWKLINDHHIEKTYTFKDFNDALAFTNRVGAIAEREGHHPDILLQWGKVTVTLWTHKIDGLTESDFILAAKADEAYMAKP